MVQLFGKFCTNLIHPKYYLSSLSITFAVWIFPYSAISQDVPDISRLDHEAQSSIRSICSFSKYFEGPAKYASCIREELANYQNSQGIPDISRLGLEAQSSLKFACLFAKYVEGPTAYASCLRKELAELSEIVEKPSDRQRSQTAIRNPGRKSNTSEIFQKRLVAKRRENSISSDYSVAPNQIKFKLSKPRPDDIAVIIGNANYKKLGRDIPNVKPAYADSEGFKKFVMDAKGVREGNIIHLKDATSAQLAAVFGNERTYKGQIFNWSKPGISNVYVYFAGHGAPAGNDGTVYLVPSDATIDSIEINGYSLNQLYTNLNKVPAKSITVVLESCFSGAYHDGTLVPHSSGLTITPRNPDIGDQITVISAGALNQIASWEKDSSQSLFTKYFLKGMSGEGDLKPYGNGDGNVTYRELGKYLEGTMTYFARRYYGRNQIAQIVNGG
jgi:hypothetical protein